jgi:phage-related protein
MYNIIFYEDKNGNKEIEEYILNLGKKAEHGNKDARINLNKIVAYMDLLEEFGTRIGEPITKHLNGEIWELRPLDNRILYAYYENNTFILLHHFTKTTQKTPKKELEKALKNLKDYRERNGD